MAVDEGYLYAQIADRLAAGIEKGVYRPGERMPSLRAIGAKLGVSLATAVQAYRTLEERGLLEARPKSGYYVRPPQGRRRWEPRPSRPPAEPARVSLGELALRMLAQAREPGLIRLGAAVPAADLLPLKSLSRIMAGVARRYPEAPARYEDSHGNRELRVQIARRLLDAGVQCDPEEVIVTNGCMEAVTLSLRALTEPGDTVVLETPSYYGILQAIEALGLNALELPTHPRSGIDMAALERAVTGGGVKACVLMPTLNNPLGSGMDDTAKRRLAAILERAGVPLIEDDIYGDLSFERPRPPAVKAFDRSGGVLLCSSFSKSIAPGYRIGYVVAGRHRDRLLHLKMLGNVATATLPQLALAEFLRGGAYERTLARATRTYRERLGRVFEAVARHFPAGTRISDPRGGFMLWVEMPPEVDGTAFYQRALEAGIAVSPGVISGARGQYRHHVRLSCGQVDAATAEATVARLGALARGLHGARTAGTHVADSAHTAQAHQTAGDAADHSQHHQDEAD